MTITSLHDAFRPSFEVYHWGRTAVLSAMSLAHFSPSTDTDAFVANANTSDLPDIRQRC